MIKGWKDKLEKYVNVNEDIYVDMKITGNADYDFCCFGVDAKAKLSDDRYMVFYNQRTTPRGEISMEDLSGGVRYTLKLAEIPAYVERLIFTVSIDGSENMGEMQNFSTKLYQPGGQDVELSLTGKDFAKERAVISIEIYRKSGWRIGCVAGGFDGGLSALLAHFGGVEVKDVSNEISSSDPGNTDTKANASAKEEVKKEEPVRVSLEKKLEKCPQLVSLAKPIGVELKKRNLESLVARVGLVLDISGSMTQRFKNGTVQEIVNKTLPLAVQFDDDGELDFWYYGTTARRMRSVNLDNYTEAVPVDWVNLMIELGGCNNEPAVLRMVLDTYKDTKLPVYVLFITDGGVSKKTEIKKIITEASKKPIFWQFVGVGGNNYGILENLDTMKGRYVDNAGFFALDDFKKVSNEELYSRLLEEFPVWLKAIKNKGMI